MGYKTKPVCPECGGPMARRESKKCWTCYNKSRYGTKVQRGIPDHPNRSAKRINYSKLTDNWLYQFAGLFMGEGSAIISKTNKGTYAARLYIGMRSDDVKVLENVYEKLGGYVQLQRRNGKGRHSLTSWQVSKMKEVKAIVELLIVYSIIPAKKLRDFHIVLNFCNWRLSQPYHIDDWSPAEKFFNNLREVRKF